MIKQSSIVGAILTLMLSGCASVNPYTGQKETAKATAYSVIGGVGGAVIGALAGGNNGALAGAVAGAAAGAGYGHYEDSQAKELRQKLAGTGVTVQESKNQIRLIMPNDITFPINGDNVKSSSYRTLDSVALVLKKYKKNLIAVNGYTDITGSVAYNDKLSRKRAISVASYLASQGVLPGRMAVHGYGPGDPIASNKTKTGRSENRRVEIIITSQKTM